jgi:hypothetical protein
VQWSESNRQILWEKESGRFDERLGL